MTPGGEGNGIGSTGSRSTGTVGRTDVVLAGALLAAGLVETWLLHTFTGDAVEGTVAIAWAALPLIWRRRAPLAVAGVVAVGLVATTPASGLSQFLAILVAVVGVARCEPRPSAVAGLVAVLAGQSAAVLLGPDPTVLDVVFGAVLYGAGWAAGRAVRRRAQQIDELRRLTGRLHDEQEALARTVVAAERARIARELHDVIAHSVSVMVVQAGAAEQLLRTDPGRAQRALEAVQETGAEAAAELRRLLGVLRAGPDEEELAPMPGLADLPRLLDQMGPAGFEVAYRVEGAGPPLPPGVDLAAYRVVQEALTNVVKHARGRRVDVTVRHTAQDVSVVVADSAAPASARALHHADGHGHGLVGLRERCAVYGGTLRTEAGPAGFTVTATLPRDGAVRSARAVPEQEARR